MLEKLDLISDSTPTPSDEIDVDSLPVDPPTDAEPSSESEVDQLKKELATLRTIVTKERKLASAAEKKAREKEREALPELQRYKMELEELARDKATSDLENRRLKIGVGELHLPLAIAERLRGDTDEEMRTDAEQLVKLYKPSGDDNKLRAPRNDGRKPPPNDGAKLGDSTSTKDFDAALRAAWSGR